MALRPSRPSDDMTDVSSSAQEAAERDHLIRTEMLATMFRMGTRNLYGGLGGMIAVCVVFWPLVPHWKPIALVAAFAVATLGYRRLFHGYAAAERTPDETPIWARQYVALSIITGSLWGLAGWWFTVWAAPVESIFMGLLLLTMVTSTMANRALYPLAYYAYAIPLATPITAAYLLQGSRVSFATGVGAIIYVVCLMLWSGTLHRSYYETIGLRHENSTLVKELRAAYQEAEAGSRAKSEFLATVSHELRTPLNGILGMSELLLSTRLDAQQQKYAATVRDSGEALLTIINDILDFTKFETGKIDIRLSEVNVVQVLENVVDLFAMRAHAKGLEIVSYVAPDLPASIRTDEGRLRQVLVNLIGNAIKFTSGGGIRCEAQSAVDDAGQRLIRFAVIDTGIGFHPAMGEKIFDPFVQGDSSISRRYGGTGLGLAISRRLVTALGGRIGAESTPGSGSQFWFTLSLGPGDAASSSRPSLADVRVLIAGCDALTAEALYRQIGDWDGAATVTATVAAARTAVTGAANSVSPFTTILLSEAAMHKEAAESAELVKNAACLSSPVQLILLCRAGDESAGRPIMNEGGPILSLPIHRDHLFEALRNPSRPAGDSTAAKGAPRSLRILLADDASVNRTIGVVALAQVGHQVDVVADGAQAVEAVRRCSYDLILMDVDMPVLDGIEAARRIRALPGVARVPILALSAYSSEEFAAQCREAGMDGYIEKPVRPDQLLATVGAYAAQAA